MSGDVAAKKKPPKLLILVTNDDGVSAEGIDAVVEGLRKLPRVKIVVSAPATNQSGTSDKTTPGELVVAEATTASGYPATAVTGFPADSVNHALDGGLKPNVVFSGVNEGQNLGPVIDLSGTVGAARTAARRGIPALAASQGLGEPPDFETGARLAVKWVKSHRKQLAKKPKAGTVTTIDNLNIPTCTAGEVRGQIDVPAATTGSIGLPSDCTSTLEDPSDDVVAFQNGFAPISTISTEKRV